MVSNLSQMGANRAKVWSERILHSRLYKNYERDFSETTHLPLSFHAVESWQLAQQGKKYENPFYALLAQTNRGCGGCLESQQKICRPVSRTQNMICFAGLVHSTVPVQIGDQVMGFLQTGQVAFKKPSSRQFKKITRQLDVWGVKSDLRRLEEAYFHTQVVAPKTYRSMVRLLEGFCEHLTQSIDQLVAQQDNADSPLITRAKKFLADRQADHISTKDVAKMVHVSKFYLCKLFKKATGLTLTEYLSQLRISNVKILLLNPNLRVSEIAYTTGFQSVTHFNRTFSRIVGHTPTHYREIVARGLV